MRTICCSSSAPKDSGTFACAASIPAWTCRNGISNRSTPKPKNNRMNIFSLCHRMVFARPAFQKLNSRLLYLALHGLGVLNYQNDTVSGERYLLGKWLPRVIRRPQPVFFDVGANNGDYSRLLVERFPAAFVHAFEPHPKNYSRFLQQAFAPDRVKC